MNRLALLYPELLLLFVPLVLLLFWRGRSTLAGGIARVVVLAILVLLAAVPLAPLGGRGVDLVVIVDRSRSMPTDSTQRALEIVKLLEDRRSAGDRIGIVTYGREARAERLPEERSTLNAFVQQIDLDGSDLGGAINLATSLIPPQRPGRLIVFSDGEATGSSVTAAAHEAAARGLPIDFRVASRGAAADIAVESLDLPGMIDEREPFQFTARVRTDRSLESEAVLLRDDVEIARTTRAFPAGETQLTFRDVIDRPGVARYRLEIRGRDRVPENNVGEGSVRVEAPAALLLVNATGAEDNLSRALASGKLRVQITTPEKMPQDIGSLLVFRAVILENVPASAIGPQGLSTLVRFSADLGGGVLLTGGRGSFGVGGYFKSELDPYLPVSMEIKNEHRKLSLAMAVVLDRSGSMAVPVAGGRTKMDLANLGTCAAIDTLGPFDEVGVIAVDSAAHVVSPLTSARDKDAICAQTRSIVSMGGGIFTYTALVAAATMVQESEKGTRHIVLFADAADAEEEGEYIRLLERLKPLGITVSVIGLGTEADSDAAFLKDIASRGGGRIVFTTSVDELPRLFAQEAITVARASFVTEPTAARTLPDMVLLGELPASPFPTLDGYNLTYLRPGATMGAVTTDEYHAPVLAFWHRGLGRVASLMAEVDGQYSRRLNAWPDYSAFAVGVGRWLLGGEAPTGVQASIDRRGGEGIVRIELDPGRPRDAGGETRTAAATIVPPGDGAKGEKLDLTWVDDDSLEARFPLRQAGTYFGAVRLPSGEVLPLAPLSLPYSPEFEPRPDPDAGRRTLVEMARVSGGIERTTWDDAFEAVRLRDRQIRDLVLPLALLLLVMHVSEIAGRRLLFFEAASTWLRTRRRPQWRRATATGRLVPQAEARGTPGPSQRATPSGDEPPTAAPAGAPDTPPSAPAESALARAKAKARARMGE